MNRILFPFFLLTVLAGNSSSLAQTSLNEAQKALPYPENFEAAKYLGKWYEIARLPSPEQPAETLATAEYSAGENVDEVLVKNTAYTAHGRLIRAMTGKAEIQSGDPPRLKVSFGPAFPDEPNYFILHVSKDYDLALVGNPSRKAMWVLSRNSTLSKERLNQMIAKAREAGFETDNLVVSDWSKARLHAAEDDQVTKMSLLGTWHYLRGEKNGEILQENHFKGQTVEFTEKEVTLKSEQMEFVMAYDFVKDTHPQAVKLTITKSPFGTGQSSEGIIAMEDGKLSLCYPPMGGDRPLKFDGSDGSRQHFFVLKRPPLSVEQMLGKWKFESGQINGRKSDAERLDGSQVVITKDKLTLNTGDATFVMEYKLDASKQPANIHLKIAEGPFGQGTSAPGIARLKNGKLIICYDPQGIAAPSKFDADDEHALFVLSRD